MQSLSIHSPSDADQRIDKFLKKYLPLAPLGGIYKWLRTGKIKVNRKKVDQTYRTEIGDTIDMHLTDEEIRAFRSSTIQLSNQPPIQPTLDILYEDAGLLVINKEAGVNVHPGDHKTEESSLIEQVHDMLGNGYNTLSFKPSLVHRIDRDTSGVILIAKEKKMLDALLTLLQSGKIEKIYHTIVVGKPPKPRGVCDAKLKRIENARDEAKVQVSKEGQEAITHYNTKQENIRDKYTLLEVRIETGRTHQIRVHMASLGCPVLGDKSYGMRGENSFAKRTYGISRQLLHAQSLSFLHPQTGKNITITAPYKDDMQSLLDA